MHNALATARGHLDKVRARQPHAASGAVSVLRRHHRIHIEAANRRANRKMLMESGKTAHEDTFDVSTTQKSRTLHLDYTGPLPTPCASGT